MVSAHIKGENLHFAYSPGYPKGGRIESIFVECPFWRRKFYNSMAEHHTEFYNSTAEAYRIL